MSESWYQSHFTPHPHKHSGNKAKKATSQTGEGQGSKNKVYCTACLDTHVEAAQKEDREAIANGTMTEARSIDDIHSHLWSLAVIGNKYKTIQPLGWRRGVRDTLVHHLTVCDHVTRGVRSAALNDKKPSSQGSSAVPMQCDPSPYDDDEPTLPIFGEPSTPSTSQHPLSASYTSSPSISGRSIYPGDSASNLGSRATSVRPRSAHHSRPPSTSRGPSRTTSLSGLQLSGLPSASLAWSKAEQQEFEEQIARATVSANLPLSWVDDVEVIKIWDRWVPAAKRVSRKVLTTRVIPNLVKRLRKEINQELNGLSVTMQADGWTGLNHQHVIAFMVTSEGKAFTVDVVNASVDRKTAEHFLELLEEAVEKAEREMKVKVVCIVTDASGETAKARRLYREKHPEVMCLDCYAHQANLVVGDYFKGSDDLMDITTTACELITWLRSKTLLLALIDACNLAHNKVTKAVLRAVLTRWTSHFIAFERLLELRQILEMVMMEDDMRSPENKKVIIGDSSAKAKARGMVAVIRDPIFWYSLTRIVRHLRPLAIATNTLQSVACRLDTVLLTFGFLAMQFTALKNPITNPEFDHDDGACNRILASLEKRWAKADQDIFIGALILNPLHKWSDLFDGIFSNAGVGSRLRALWVRFFGESCPPAFDQEVRDYLRRSGRYRFIDSEITIEETDARINGREPDPMNIYQAISAAGAPDTPLIRLARHLFSAGTNSASCERLFSAFGNILTKLRNRLGVVNMQNITELKMRVNDGHRNDKDTQTRLKRHFVADKPLRSATGSAFPPESPRVQTAPIPTEPTSNASDYPPSDALPSRNTLAALIAAQTEDDDVPVVAPTQVTLSPVPSPASSPDLTSMRLFSNTDRPAAPAASSGSTATPEPDVILDPEGPITLAILFNFKKAGWHEKYKRAGLKTYQEELALYELLELDAQGEDDDFDLEPANEATFIAMLQQTT